MKNPTVKRKSRGEMIVARGRLRGALTDLFEETEENISDESSTSDQNEANYLMQQRNENLPRRGRPPKKLRNIVSNSTAVQPQTQATSDEVKCDMKTALSKSPMKRRLLQQPRVQEEPEIKIEATEPSSGVNQHLQSYTKSGEGFVMKLFDRNLDLSKFAEETPIYPISRAWFKNQPRNSALPSYHNRRTPSPCKREKDGAEFYNKVRNNEIWEVYGFPQVLESKLSKIPSPLSPKFNGDINAVDKAINDEENNWFKTASVEEIMDFHSVRWKKVRQNWVEHTTQYRQERFKYSYLILENLYKKYKPCM